MASYSDIDYGFLGQGDLKGDYTVRIANLSPHTVQYVLEDPKVSRLFAEAKSTGVDTKSIQFHELYTLWNSPGGQRLVYDHLQIQDNRVREALGLPTDPEFGYSYSDIKRLVVEGEEEEILDAIEFGPYYIPQWMKQIVVTEGLNDFSKRKFFSNLFNMKSLDDAQDLFEWSKGDESVGAKYAELQGERSTTASNSLGGGRQRRAGRAHEPAQAATPVRRKNN